MKAVYPKLFPNVVINCNDVRNVITDGKYIIIFLYDNTYIKSILLDLPFDEIGRITTSINRQIKRCQGLPKPMGT